MNNFAQMKYYLYNLQDERISFFFYISSESGVWSSIDDMIYQPLRRSIWPELYRYLNDGVGLDEF